MRRVVLIIPLVFLLASCTAATVAKGVAGAALGGGGPNTAANVQAGKTNSQTLGENKVIEMKGPVARSEVVETLNQTTTQTADENTVTADRVETVVVTQNQVPAWLLVGMAALIVLFGVVGWLSPQPRWLRRSE